MITRSVVMYQTNERILRLRIGRGGSGEYLVVWIRRMFNTANSDL